MLRHEHLLGLDARSSISRRKLIPLDTTIAANTKEHITDLKDARSLRHHCTRSSLCLSLFQNVDRSSSLSSE